MCKPNFRATVDTVFMKMFDNQQQAKANFRSQVQDFASGISTFAFDRDNSLADKGFQAGASTSPGMR